MLIILAMCVVGRAQDTRSEVSVQGAGFFTKSSDGKGIYDSPTQTGGILIGYRYKLYRWLSVEGNYGYARNTQEYSGATWAQVQANVHQVTGAGVMSLPSFANLRPFALGGGGALVFDPTGNPGGTYAGASRQARGALLYGGGADYPLTSRLAIRAEYRGFVYKTPTFNLAHLNTNSWTHTAQPSAGIVIKF
ncbi:MAG TPA: outer membrane beta-barrel protein [Dongiaceae bacterium]|nr:outer membrane beta-barrel protein [Dongiaceae bacterium]